MGLRSIGFSVVGTDGGAAFQELMPNYIRSFVARQLTDEPDYGKCKTLCSRFKKKLRIADCELRSGLAARFGGSTALATNIANSSRTSFNSPSIELNVAKFASNASSSQYSVSAASFSQIATL